MRLKPQDVVVLIKLLEYGSQRPPISHMARELLLSSSEVHGALQRAVKARLLNGGDRNSHEVPNVANLLEFLVHGIKYAFPAERGELTRGLPTGYAAPPLKTRISQGSDPPPVWPCPEGKHRGYSFAPLYKTVPKAAMRDEYLYEVLALVDAIRDGKARERQLAQEELATRLRNPRHAKSND